MDVDFEGLTPLEVHICFFHLFYIIVYFPETLYDSSELSFNRKS